MLCMSRLRTLIAQLEECLSEATVMTAQPKVGDILYSSWGYDQTNIDFYKVLKVTKASVKIQKTGKKLVGGQGGPQEKVVSDMVVRSDSKPMTKRFRQDSYKADAYSVKISSYASAYLWDGQPKSQTGGGYGH